MNVKPSVASRSSGPTRTSPTTLIEVVPMAIALWDAARQFDGRRIRLRRGELLANRLCADRLGIGHNGGDVAALDSWSWGPPALRRRARRAGRRRQEAGLQTTFPPLPIAPNTPLFIIKDSPTLYLVEGQLSSTRAGKRAGCHVRRKVRLHVLHPNNTDTVIASWKPKSISLFNFRVELVPSESVYVSTPAKEFVTRSGKRVHCASGRSVPQPVLQ
jgi:hypothetical protein